MKCFLAIHQDKTFKCLALFEAEICEERMQLNENGDKITTLVTFIINN